MKKVKMHCYDGSIKMAKLFLKTKNIDPADAGRYFYNLQNKAIGIHQGIILFKGCYFDELLEDQE